MFITSGYRHETEAQAGEPGPGDIKAANVYQCLQMSILATNVYKMVANWPMQ